MKVSDANMTYTNQRAAASRLRLEKEQVDRERKVFRNKLTKMKEKNRRDALELERDYQNQIDTDNSSLKRQLNQVRNKNTLALKAEVDRAQHEVYNLKKSHDIQVDELAQSQDSELQRMHEEHKENLYNARRKFEREFAKYQL